MKVKVNVKTPKNQADKCIKTQKAAILGHSQSQKILEEEVVSDHEFYWVLQLDNPKEYTKILEKAARGEMIIKKFYRTLFKLIDRANKLSDKFGKGVGWIRRWIIRKVKKQQEKGGDDSIIQQIQEMSDGELRDFIKVTDRAELEKLLGGELINVEEIK